MFRYPSALRSLRNDHATRKATSVTQVRNWTTLTRTKDALTIHALKDTSFPYIWLRDSCQSEGCVHPSTSQKLHRTSDIPLFIAPITDGVHVTPTGIDITWTDGHQSSFNQNFLARHASASKLAEWHHDDHLAEQSWTRESISSTSNLFIPYDKLSTSSGLVDAITQLSKYGLLFVSGVPNKETSNEKCELRKLAERFGEIRPTFYGLLWDVVNVRNSRNIAYTNLDLGLHMDLLYFQHPPRYQILHCLRNQVIGGTSIFVDALQAARVLRTTHPTDFEVLTKTPVSFHYVNDGHHLHREHSTIELSSSTQSPQPEISHINYSPPFQAPLPLNTPKEFYPAFARFADLLNDPKNTFEYTLREGDAVVFDNRRALHARTAFNDKPGSENMEDGEPNRWLKGCYLEADALVDRVRVLKTKLEKGLVE
ncbi:gamma-butyrobetaine hydroxylase [Gymnopilus junonius]|uniref:Gamma-butyrobetaine hydroxylase n=1 Tax=Gymnopilus junonius TaxID=109634 RepID=A0A9P5NIN6_GYMJU|nr:gamma-butyrobetaine hydroxylase [Gymnopilus junonius]